MKRKGKPKTKTNVSLHCFSAALFCAALKPMDTTFIHTYIQMHVSVHTYVHLYGHVCSTCTHAYKHILIFMLSQLCFFCFCRVLHLFICMAICRILFIYKSIALNMCMHACVYVFGVFVLVCGMHQNIKQFFIQQQNKWVEQAERRWPLLSLATALRLSWSLPAGILIFAYLSVLYMCMYIHTYVHHAHF